MSLADDAQLGVLAARQHGVFTRAQALQAGFRAGRIERRVRAGVWLRVFPRVYRHVTVPVSGATRHWAAVLWCGQPGALSHTSAAAIWRMRDEPVTRPELSVPCSRAPRAVGVDVHRVARLDFAWVRGLPVTAPARTVVDLAGVLPLDDLEQVLTRVLARHVVTVRAVLACLDEVGSAGRPGASLLRDLLAPIGSVRAERSVRMAG